MRLLALFAIALMGCDPDGACHGLKSGQSTAGLMGGPVTQFSELFTAPPATGGYVLGDALRDYCCAVRSTGGRCAGADCSGLSGITARRLEEPYTRIVNSGPPQDLINYCFIAEHEGAITSVWIKIYTD